MAVWDGSLRKHALLVALGVVVSSASMSKPTFADAETTTNALINALVAAVVNVTEDTVETGNVGPNSRAISLLVPRGAAYRLVDASGDPLDPRNKPRGRFEKQGLQKLVGQPAFSTVQDEGSRKLRTLFSLPFLPGCETCHTNYARDFEEGDIVGAISVKVRLHY